MLILEYLSKTVLSGVRPYELEILNSFLKGETLKVDDMKDMFHRKYGCEIDMESLHNAVDVLKGHFVSNAEEYKKYSQLDIVDKDSGKTYKRMKAFSEKL